LTFFEQLLILHTSSVDKLYFALTFFAFMIGNDPHVSTNTCIVKQLIWKSNNRFQPVIFYDPFTNITFSTFCGTGKQRRTIEYNANTASGTFHFGNHMLKEQ